MQITERLRSPSKACPPDEQPADISGAKRSHSVRLIYRVMTACPNVAEIARRFAGALDGEEYEAVRAMLAPDCRYEVPNRGPCRAGCHCLIVSRHSATARRLFDAVEYRSEPDGIDSTHRAHPVFRIALRIKAGRTSINASRRCRCNPDGLIAVIRHEELPEEREGLLEFCAACGVALGDAAEK